MATVDREFADLLIKGNGRLPDDQEDAPDNPRASVIVEYTNFGGLRVCGVVFENEPNQNKYKSETQFIRNPVVIWELK